MSFVAQLRAVEDALADDWTDVHLSLRVADETRRDRAAALLGPLAPGRLGPEFRFSVARRGAGGPGLETLRRILRLLDAEGMDGTLTLLGSTTAEAEPPPEPPPSLVKAWDAALRDLPDDWSDLYCEIELASSDYLDRAALLTAPLNPSRYGATPGFRFRVARSFGYGASPQMARRCHARLDEGGIIGTVRVLRVLSDTKPVATQGPVWYAGGKVI